MHIRTGRRGDRCLGDTRYPVGRVAQVHTVPVDRRRGRECVVDGHLHEIAGPGAQDLARHHPVVGPGMRGDAAEIHVGQLWRHGGRHHGLAGPGVDAWSTSGIGAFDDEPDEHAASMLVAATATPPRSAVRRDTSAMCGLLVCRSPIIKIPLPGMGVFGVMGRCSRSWAGAAAPQRSRAGTGPRSRDPERYKACSAVVHATPMPIKTSQISPGNPIRFPMEYQRAGREVADQDPHPDDCVGGP